MLSAIKIRRCKYKNYKHVYVVRFEFVGNISRIRFHFVQFDFKTLIGYHSKMVSLLEYRFHIDDGFYGSS